MLHIIHAKCPRTYFLWIMIKWYYLGFPASSVPHPFHHWIEAKDPKQNVSLTFSESFFIFLHTNSCSMPFYQKNVKILVLLWGYWILKLLKGFFEGKKQNNFTKLFSSLSCLFSFCHIHGHFRKGLKHFKLIRWRKIMSNCYSWCCCDTWNYTQTICSVFNCHIWACRRSHLILLCLHFLESCSLGRKGVVKWDYFGFQCNFSYWSTLFNW